MKETYWKPVEGQLLSRWSGDVDPEQVLPEYPRPQLRRERWLNLNGLWEYAIVPKHWAAVEAYQGSILVPFPIESALSGVKKELLPEQRLWYRRRFFLPDDWQEEHILLHLGAVDYQAEVWVNGEYVGKHSGGSLPFSFEIGHLLQKGAEAEIVVAVWDPSDAGNQQRGKQVSKPNTIWYTPASGIWQTVWLEPVPAAWIDRLQITPDIDKEELHLTAYPVREEGQGLQIRVVARSGDKTVAEATGLPGQQLTLSIASPQLWSPDSPHLYDLEVSLLQGERLLDQVSSYFAMRKFHLAPDGEGHQRIHLNNQPLFHYGPLDQGYWPDGLYTAPTDEALQFDILYAKKIGCNMIRKHIKVEPLRWYYHCDRLGMIVWQDMPNGGKPVGGLTSLLAMFTGIKVDDRRRLKRAGRADPENRSEFEVELKDMVDLLFNSPCIGMWVPFNEGWGQYDASRIAAWLKEYDPGRLVDHASGWFDQGAGDFLSLHTYFRDLKLPELDPERSFILSEFGGYSLKIDRHVWNPQKKFGYRSFDTPEALTEGYLELVQEQLLPLISLGLAGAVYTQTTDVEIEVNGYLTYDREVEKMDGGRLRAAHRPLYSTRFGLGSKK